MSLSLIQKVGRKATASRYRRFLPSHHLNEDIFLVSFPKSGNTWFRFLVANVLKFHYQIDREVNFFSIHDIIPDVYISRNISPSGPFGIQGLPRLIKSHDPYNPFYYRAIVLVRNPEKVMLSYYAHLRNYNRIPESMTLSEMIAHQKYGIEAWNTHTRSWIDQTRDGHIIQIFQYEKLLENTIGQISRFFDLLGLKTSEETLKQAIEASSKRSMQASDAKHFSTQLLKQRTSGFVRGSKGNTLSTEDIQYIRHATKEVCQELDLHSPNTASSDAASFEYSVAQSSGK